MHKKIRLEINIVKEWMRKSLIMLIMLIMKSWKGGIWIMINTYWVHLMIKNLIVLQASSLFILNQIICDFESHLNHWFMFKKYICFIK